MIVLALMVWLSSSGCVSVDRSLVSGRKRAYGYTWEQEVQLGQESDAQVIAQFGLYEDPELEKYVSDLGNELLAVSHLRRPEASPAQQQTPFTFRLLDSPVVNAFALPGGYVYVTRGLLAHLDNRAQLAVVLGHEIGHVVGRHASKRAASQQFGQLLVVGGAIGAGAALGGEAAQSILETGSQVAGLLFLRYGRDDERESDMLGVEYSAMKGYKAGEGSALFTSLKRISDAAGQSIPSFMSTHPDPGEREVTIQEMAAEWDQKLPDPMDRVDEEQYMAQLDNMVLGDDPRQGYVENGIFYHPELRFQFSVPSNFQLINQPTQVVMVDQNQKGIIVFTLEQENNTAQAAGTAFASQEGITVVNQRSLQTNGLAAYNVLANVATQEGQEIQVVSHYIEHGNNVYNFLAYSLKSDFDSYSRSFSSSIDGFRNLTDQSKINVQPTRLRVFTTPSNGPFQSFLPSVMPRGFTPESLAILNQVEVNQVIPRGTRLKLPR